MRRGQHQGHSGETEESEHTCSAGPSTGWLRIPAGHSASQRIYSPSQGQGSCRAQGTRAQTGLGIMAGSTARPRLPRDGHSPTHPAPSAPAKGQQRFGRAQRTTPGTTPGTAGLHSRPEHLRDRAERGVTGRPAALRPSGDTHSPGCPRSAQGGLQHGTHRGLPSAPALGGAGPGGQRGRSRSRP